MEQNIFQDSDRDEIDAQAIPLAAVATLSGMDHAIIGTVRIYEQLPGLWFGSRLAVARSHRRIGGIGTHLIRLAVCLAHAKGAATFLAHVQSQNAALFHSLHWHTLEELTLHGHPHHLMQADLAHYPAEAARPLHLLLPMRDAA